MRKPKPGDLVVFNPAGKLPGGTLTSVKYFQRIRESCGKSDKGIVIAEHGTSYSVMFEKNLIVINGHYLDILSKEDTK